MAFCPACKTKLEDGVTTCHICGQEINDTGKVKWVVLGMIEDKISADYAKETLKSYNIPAVVISKSGFFGEIGLPLSNFYKSGVGLFEVSVLEESTEEAIDILNMILGEKWQRKED